MKNWKNITIFVTVQLQKNIKIIDTNQRMILILKL